MVGRDAGAEPGVREVERGGLQVRVVEELCEDGGKLVVCTGAGLAALGACLRVVGWRVEGDDAADADFGALVEDGDCGAFFAGGDEGEGGGAGLAEHGDAVEAREVDPGAGWCTVCGGRAECVVVAGGVVAVEAREFDAGAVRGIIRGGRAEGRVAIDFMTQKSGELDA